jgi:hypothetical protein
MTEDPETEWPEARHEYIHLDPPRPLTPKERALLDFLLTSPLAREELREQATSARVEALCWCGCPSVVLQIDSEAPRARYTPAEENHPGVVYITAYQRKSRWPWTEVTLHGCDGELEELEIWAGKYSVRPRVDPARLEFQSDIAWPADS